mgnify:CR=1 FL=1
MSEPVSPSEEEFAILTEQDDAVTDDLAEIIDGLSRIQKTLSPKYFYDERGSALFEAICELPEYYPTRTELGIMRAHIADIAERVGPRASVIELGSGSSVKTRILLEHLDQPAAYVPVDISRDHLVAAAAELARDFPAIEVLPVAADFTHPFPLPSPRIPPLRNLVYFPGSTIGNFSATAALELLCVMHQEAGDNGALLIGIIQGTLAGIGFTVAGIDAAVFWGAIMAVLSILPGIGAPLIWVPAVIYLLMSGQTAAGIGLLVWCVGVVGSIDNFLRPVLVGRDTKMPYLLILLSTLGGVALFGATGLFLGPILAALFLTVLAIYSAAFADWLHPKDASPQSPV